MKVKAPSLLKKIIEALSTKTNEIRIRMTIFFLLHKNIDRTSLTQSLHALVSHHPSHHSKKKNDDALEEEEQLFVGDREDDEEDKENNGSLWMNYNKATTMMGINNTHVSAKYEEANNVDCDNQAGVDLTHALFKELKAEMEKEVGESEEAVEGGGTVDDVVEEEVAGDEDIDQAADLFIRRFKQQIMLQKQHSLEREHRLLVSNA